MEVIDRARTGDDDRTLGDERSRDGKANAFARACDDADLAFEFEVHALTCSLPGQHRTRRLLAGGAYAALLAM
ncbi:MAG: hypothetical protein ACREH9_12215 [Pseudomonadota bacterium]